jgi:hypothetical protein
MEVVLPTISVSRKKIAGIIAAVLFLGLGILAIEAFKISRPIPTPTPSQDDAQASAAVVAGVEAFFNVNYQEGKDVWLGRFCQVSTEGGCLFVKTGSAALWKRYDDSKTITSARVTPRAKIKQSDTEQLWQVSVQLVSPLPGSEKTNDVAYVVAVRTHETWKFDRFLLAQEIRALKTQTPAGQNQ